MKPTSLARRIALQFFLVIALLVLVLSLVLVALFRISLRRQQNRELREAALSIIDSRHENGVLPLSSIELRIPYYITYTIYNAKTEAITATNDPFIPALPVTTGKPQVYFEKDFFTDGDLHILYYAVPLAVDGGADTIVQVSLSLDQNDDASLLRFVPRVLASIFAPLLILSYLAAYVIAKRTLRPIVQMTASAADISSEHLDARLPVTSRQDELDSLATTFNDLFARLQADFARERQFTSDVSHELKTPLAVIMGEAKLLQRWGKDDPAVLAKATNALVEESHMMEAIITNLLQLSHLENGRIQPKTETVPLRLLCKRLLEHTTAWAEQTKIDYSSVDESLCITTDGELLYQVFTILLSNSIKFAGADTRITITATQLLATEQNGQNKARTTIRFADNGSGIAPQALPHIFERFYRADPAHTRSVEGNGLGLAIAKQIMTVLGGSISAENAINKNTNERCGAIFLLTL